MVNESNEPQKAILPRLRRAIWTTLEHGKITVMYSVIQKFVVSNIFFPDNL